MKISLEESRKRASPEKLTAELYGEFNQQLLLQAENGTVIAVVSEDTSLCPEYVTIDRANAALLAHCWNRFDEVVAALEEALDMIGAHSGDRLSIRAARPMCEKLSALLQRAKEVEIP